MQQLPEEVILRFRARLCSNPTSPQFQSLRPYIWVKESGSGLRLIARQEVFCSDGTPSQDDRAFVIEVHTVDETIAIFEERASGGFGGCVFARAHVPSANRGEHIKPCDIYSGGTLAVAGRTFEVLEADAFTMKHVRAHPLQFPQRALSSVLRAIIDAQQLESVAYAFAQCDLTACGCVSTNHFMHVMATAAGAPAVLQDRIALAQEYVVEAAGSSSELKISYVAFLAALRAVAHGQAPQSLRPFPSTTHPHPHNHSHSTTSWPTNFIASAAASTDPQLQLRKKLLARGLDSGRKFLCALLDSSRALHGALDVSSLQQALLAVGIRDSSPSQLHEIISSFGDSRPSVHDVLSSVQRSFDCGHRAAICTRIFAALDRRSSGFIVSTDLVGTFDCMAACELLRCYSPPSEVRAQWIAAFDGHASAAGAISKDNFLAAMRELSWIFVEDNDFAAFVGRCLGAKTSLLSRS
jgi:hypothetical protein